MDSLSIKLQFKLQWLASALVASALAASLNASAAPPAGAAPVVLAQAATECKSCGEVTAVRSVEVAGKGSGVGAGVGAVVGGVLGNQVGGGTGRTLATVGGAAAGGYAGNEIEKRVRKEKQFEVVVRMQSGKSKIFRFEQQPRWEVGDLVKVVNGTLFDRDE
jgi:outer membrane lipoprotein SlyB